jgi:WD40 repeat protein
VTGGGFIGSEIAAALTMVGKKVAFSLDGKTVVTSGADGTARIWNPQTGQDIMVFKGYTDEVTGAAFRRMADSS